MDFWQFKFNEKHWKDYCKAKESFETFTHQHKKLANRIGDIAFWYKTDGKRGIYFVCEIASQPKKVNDKKYALKMRIIKTFLDKPFVLEENGFLELAKKINARGQGGSVYLFEDEDKGKKLYKMLCD